jgi:drug/metabolite transporter (DMT)-like permease
MTPGLAAWLVLAALLHAVWNVLLKRVADRQLAVWLSVVVSAGIGVAVLAFRPSIGPAGWGLALASAVLEVLYYRTLMRAYGVGDFSVVYPLARGVAPALLACWTFVLLGERPTPAGWLGISLLVAGILVVGRSARLAGGTGRRRVPDGAGLALVVAVLISSYSAVDGVAVKHVDAVAYAMAVYLLTALMMAVPVWRSHGRQGIVGGLRRCAPVAACVGILQLLGYSIVLWVYARATVSYAGAIREISIPLGACAGWIWLREELGARRLAGAAVMAAGLVLILLKG